MEISWNFVSLESGNPDSATKEQLRILFEFLNLCVLVFVFVYPLVYSNGGHLAPTRN